MLRTKIVIALSAVVLVSLPAVARAEEPQPAAERGRPFHRGEVVLDDVVGLRLATASWSPSIVADQGLFPAPPVYGIVSFDHQDGEAPWTASDGTPTRAHWRSDVLTVAPSLDVLVTDHVSIGGRLVVTNTHTRDDYGEYNNLSFAIAPRVGYVVPLGRDLAFWPRAGLGFAYAQDGNGSDGRPTQVTWSGDLDLPLVARVGRVALKLGPEVGASWLHSTTTFADGTSTASGTIVHVGVSGSVGFVF